MNNSELLHTAREWITLGQSVIPIRYMDKRPNLGSWDPYKIRLATDTELVDWFGNGNQNIAIITGVNNLIVLDFDDNKSYTKFLQYSNKLEETPRYKIMNTFHVKTNRGYHIYFLLPYPMRTLGVQGIDIKARWGYVLTPPSVHPTGAHYEIDYPGWSECRDEPRKNRIQRINALSDVLPPQLLVRDVPIPAGVHMPLPLVKAAQIEADPWQSAQQAGEQNQSAVEKIKKKYDIKSFFTDIERTSLDGRYYLTRCPLHDDHNPSMWIDTTLQLCGCYSGCTERPLDVINLFARLKGLSNSDAIKIMVKGN